MWTLGLPETAEDGLRGTTFPRTTPPAGRPGNATGTSAATASLRRVRTGPPALSFLPFESSFPPPVPPASPPGNRVGAFGQHAPPTGGNRPQFLDRSFIRVASEPSLRVVSADRQNPQVAEIPAPSSRWIRGRECAAGPPGPSEAWTARRRRPVDGKVR